MELEVLEDRTLLSGVQALASPGYVLAENGGTASPLGSPTPPSTAYTPSQIAAAYGFNQIHFTSNGSPVAANGAGTTIAIIDAYNDPTISPDLTAFDQQFGLSAANLTVVNENGGTALPSNNASWSVETSLDVEWAHAVAPGASILLVEASSASYTDLLKAVSYAANQPGVVAVSMSWGGSEFSGETTYDSTFTTPSGHTGVTFVASSGDSGAPTSYPAASPHVLSVGGTSLYLSGGSYSSESAWSGSGGGISTVESQPAYQNGVVTQSTTFRTNPDVSYDADPNTGFPVYDSYANGASTPWEQVGGTSDAAPQWAALIAIADQGRALAGEQPLDGVSQTLPMLYSLPSSDFHDITSGSSTGTPNYSAGTGYDLATGRGTPYANLVVSGLIGSTSTPPSTGTYLQFVSVPTSGTAGSTLSTVQVEVMNSSGLVTTDNTDQITLSLLGAPAGTLGGTTTATVTGGIATFSNLVIDTASSYTLQAASGSLTAATAPLSITPAAASKLVFGQQPSNVVVGSVISPAVTVLLEDAYGNVITTDSTDKVSLSLTSNPTGAILGGTTTATLSNGVATFSTLTVNTAGTGDTLQASFSTSVVTAATSAAFTVSSTPSSSTIENFENGLGMYYAVAGPVYGTTDSAGRHDGNYGLDLLDQSYSPGWAVRFDSAAQVTQGEAISVWVQLPGTGSGRAYFAFGASANGALSAVLAPNTGQLLIQNNSGWGFTNLAAVSQSIKANTWYRLEVDWAVGGGITVGLYASNGTTLLNSVHTTVTSVTSGGIGFRGTDYHTYFDSVTVSPLTGPSTHSADDGSSIGVDAAGLNAGTLPSGVNSSSTQTAAPTTIGSGESPPLASVAVALAARLGGATEAPVSPASALGATFASPTFTVFGSLSAAAGGVTPFVTGVQDEALAAGLGDVLESLPEDQTLPSSTEAERALARTGGDAWFLAAGAAEESTSGRVVRAEEGMLALGRVDHAVEGVLAALLLTFTRLDGDRENEAARRR